MYNKAETIYSGCYLFSFLCMMYGDLHSHSTDSDGNKTNSERVQEIVVLDPKRTGIWSLTNHDTYSASFIEEARAEWIHAVWGTEISAYSSDLDVSLHVTCYTPVLSEGIRKLVEGIVSARRVKTIKQIAKLQAQGFPVEERWFFDWVEWKGMSVDFASNWHLACYLWKQKKTRELTADLTKGKVRWVEGFLQECLKSTGDFSHIGNYRIPEYEPELRQLSRIAEQEDMVLSIAHPNFSFLKVMKKRGIPLDRSSAVEYFSESIVPKLVDSGIRNLEINALAEPEWVDAIRKNTERVGGIITFGSDNHGLAHTDSRHGIFGQINPALEERDLRPIISRLS